MRHVFVSYCREDVDFARTLETQLELRGLIAWRDVGLRAGEDWRAEIDRGIREALAVIVVMSDDALGSAYVNYEWSFALGSEIPVMTVLCKPISGQLHSKLKERPWVDLSVSEAAGWRRLFEHLEEAEDALQPNRALATHSIPPPLHAAVHSLNSMDAAERDAALGSLAQTTHPQVVEVLADVVRHPVRRVRHLAAVELAKRGDARAIPPLLQALRESQPDYPIVTDYMLSEPGPAAVPALSAALADRLNDKLRPAIYEALGRIGGPQATAVLRSHLGSPLADDRYSAALALAPQADAAALPVLVEAAGGADASTRRSAIYALSNYAATFKDQVLPAFLDALGDSDDAIVRAGLHGLEAANDPAVIPYLLDSFFRVSYDFMNSGVRFALEKFGSLATPQLRKAITCPDPQIRLRAVLLLKTLNDTADLDLFRRATHDADCSVKIAAIKALGREDASEAVPELLECLDDDDGAVVSAAIWTLATIRDARAVPPLLDLLETGYGEILRRTIVALGNIGLPGAAAVPRLIAFLGDKDLAPAASQALQDIGTRDARAASRRWEAQRGA